MQLVLPVQELQAASGMFILEYTCGYIYRKGSCMLCLKGSSIHFYCV